MTTTTCTSCNDKFNAFEVADRVCLSCLDKMGVEMDHIAPKLRRLERLHAFWAAEIRDYASANYEVDGWDYVVEAYTDAELIEAFGDAPSYREAFRRVRNTVKLVASVRDDVRGA